MPREKEYIMAPKAKTTNTLKRGTHVSWHYRGAIGHGTIAGVYKKGTTSATTEYSINESDHHPGEAKVLHHFGRALSVSRGKKK